jgi:nucleotide-binding universal stress UspA family protein
MTAPVTRKIVVGIDLSPDAERALAHAVAIARRDGREVVLVHAETAPALPEGLFARDPDAAAAYLRGMKAAVAASRAGIVELRERWGKRGVEVSQLVVDGHPDQVLPNTAVELGADLIAVGTHGRTGLARLFLGSVAEMVARLADRSVLVARGEAPAGGYRRVVVGTDFSPLAERALDQALALAGAGARLELVHCWQLTPWATSAEIPGGMNDRIRAELLADLRQSGEALLARVRERREDLDVQLELLERPAAHGLDRHAKDIDADLVVVGSHGRRGLRRFLLGSVAEVTVRHAPCSVLVAR